MTGHTLVWQPAAVAGLVRVRAEDRQVAKALRTTIGALADDPRPPESAPLAGDLRRLRLGRVRVLYDVDDAAGAVHILTVGMVAP